MGRHHARLAVLAWSALLAAILAVASRLLALALLFLLALVLFFFLFLFPLLANFFEFCIASQSAYAGPDPAGWKASERAKYQNMDGLAWLSSARLARKS